jgi:nicotine blue oxidoreductase
VLERLQALTQVIVVSGAYELEGAVHCPDWERGPGASLRCGLAALAEDAEAAVVVLADGPDLAPAAIDRVVAAWEQTGAPLVAASYGGDRGHPLLLARSLWADVPDEGLRGVEPLLVPCDDLGSPGDVDYRRELPERFRSGPDEPM